MKRYIGHKLLLILGILLLASCRQEECPQTEEGTSLQLTIKAAESPQDTRGVQDLNDDGTVTEEEMIVDGQRMYSLAVFLLDGNRVVSSAVLDANNAGFKNNHTEATVSFTGLDYTKTYKLYAVANYGNYGELKGKLANVTTNNVTSGLTVAASNDKLCNKNTPYPLTLTQDITLNPGENTISGELVRTYARIRISVCNKSTQKDLYVNKLAFPANFTQNSVNIFTEGGTANAQPVVTSADAITPFVANTMIPKLVDEGNTSGTTIFDSYLLESTGGEYNYTLELDYQNIEDKIGNEFDRINGIKDGGLYVMRSNGGLYLHDNGTTNFVGVGQSPLTNGRVNRDYVWILTKINDRNNYYTIQSSRGRYMQSSKVDGNGIPLVANRGNNDYFTAQNFPWGDEGINFITTNGSYWLSTADGKACGHTSSIREFFLSEVTISSTSEEVTIPIGITGGTSPITAIKRNDFIDITVNVTKGLTGELEYEVVEWNTVNGNVTFN